MLSEEDIKYVFCEENLEAGDILLMNTYHETQRSRMNCKYDHAAIYLGDTFLVEADGLGVVMNQIYSYPFKNKDDACALRLKKRNPLVIKKVKEYALSNYGMEFGTREAFAVPIKKDTDERETSNRMFCSRLVSQAYNVAGIPLTHNPDYCAPDDFLTSDALEVVTPSTRAVDDEILLTVLHQQQDRNEAEGTDMLPTLFSDFSQLYGEDIQTFVQILHAAIKNPDKDDEAIKIIKDSKYFDFAGGINKRWTWLYNDTKFIAHHGTIEKCLFFINNQFLHFDRTYLPIYCKNVANINLIYAYNYKSQLLAYIRNGFVHIQDEAVKVRQRLSQLYEMVLTTYPEESIEFIKNYGYYESYGNFRPTIDIDDILKFAFEYGLPSKEGIEALQKLSTQKDIY